MASAYGALNQTKCSSRRLRNRTRASSMTTWAGGMASSSASVLPAARSDWRADGGGVAGRGGVEGDVRRQPEPGLGQGRPVRLVGQLLEAGPHPVQGGQRRL